MRRAVLRCVGLAMIGALVGTAVPAVVAAPATSAVASVDPAEPTASPTRSPRRRRPRRRPRAPPPHQPDPTPTRSRSRRSKTRTRERRPDDAADTGAARVGSAGHLARAAAGVPLPVGAGAPLGGERVARRQRRHLPRCDRLRPAEFVRQARAVDRGGARVPGVVRQRLVPRHRPRRRLDVGVLPPEQRQVEPHRHLGRGRHTPRQRRPDPPLRRDAWLDAARAPVDPAHGTSVPDGKRPYIAVDGIQFEQLRPPRLQRGLRRRLA